MTSRIAFLMAALAVASAARAESVDASKQDARLNAAMAQSLATLPTFDAAITRHQKAMLDVRVPYGDGRSESVWLGAVRHNADGSYDGIILDDVAHLPDLGPGAFYHARRDQVADWIYEDEKASTAA